ncbi:hypothetical protein BZL30_6664 [Mycobacterium kansasii]|uniref:Uncharacterized protein n=1 Tax=Mycobacterium kansasii TaxID=1768 RepID=A0A1V3WUI5_MYCKA|nr:hypothetical protein BZL30_6664 [Mycobacterium kansasii]
MLIGNGGNGGKGGTGFIPAPVARVAPGAAVRPGRVDLAGKPRPLISFTTSTGPAVAAPPLHRAPRSRRFQFRERRSCRLGSVTLPGPERDAPRIRTAPKLHLQHRRHLMPTRHWPM